VGEELINRMQQRFPEKSDDCGSILFVTVKETRKNRVPYHGRNCHGTDGPASPVDVQWLTTFSADILGHMSSPNESKTDEQRRNVHTHSKRYSPIFLIHDLNCHYENTKNSCLAKLVYKFFLPCMRAPLVAVRAIVHMPTDLTPILDDVASARTLLFKESFRACVASVWHLLLTDDFDVDSVAPLTSLPLSSTNHARSIMIMMITTTRRLQ
jgi:hypothetical protein